MARRCAGCAALAAVILGGLLSAAGASVCLWLGLDEALAAVGRGDPAAVWGLLGTGLGAALLAGGLRWRSSRRRRCAETLVYDPGIRRWVPAHRGAPRLG